MAIKIAIANQKGGVGKTTSAINIADALTHLNYKVLLLDLDPQHNSTATYGAEIDGVNTIVDVLKKDCTAKEAIQHMPIGDIIAGDGLLAQEENYFNSQKARETLLKRAIKSIDDDYDYIIMDTPPNLGIYMTNALTAADGCVIPIKSEQYAISGLGLLIETINEINEVLNDKLKIYGVKLNVYDKRNKLDRETLRDLPQAGENSGFHVFKTPIRISQEIKKVQSMPDSFNDNGERIVTNRSLYLNYPNSNGAIDYVNFIKELQEEIYNG